MIRGNWNSYWLGGQGWIPVSRIVSLSLPRQEQFWDPMPFDPKGERSILDQNHFCLRKPQGFVLHSANLLSTAHQGTSLTAVICTAVQNYNRMFSDSSTCPCTSYMARKISGSFHSKYVGQILLHWLPPKQKQFKCQLRSDRPGLDQMTASHTNNIISEKVKLSLCLNKCHAVKTYWGSGDIAASIFNPGTNGGEWSASRPGSFTLGIRAPGTH
jgi:hypothetical protein